MEPLPPELVRTIQENPVNALLVGVERTIEMSWLTVESIGKMISGVLSPENLSSHLLSRESRVTPRILVGMPT